jgi:isopentenyl phosphate kinase
MRPGPEAERPAGAARGPVLPTIVKLGGSVITRKRDVERLRPKVLDRLARELASAAELPRILLHGAGSFGHPGARRWGLARPPERPLPDAQRRRGAAIVQAEVRRLHGKVLAALLDAGESPVSVPVAAHATNRAGALAAFDPAPFVGPLAEGMLPVSFGDVVPDLTWGRSILSADTIALALVRTLGARRVLFVSDVPGVYVDPRHPGPIVAELSGGSAAPVAGAPSGPDVTGGIEGKVRAMRAIAALGVDAALISGLADGTLSRAIRGETVYGSWARATSRPAVDAR